MMKSRTVLLMLCFAICAVFAWLPFAYPGSATTTLDQVITLPPTLIQVEPISPFNPVFAIMNRPRQQMGCVGCHINPQPQPGIPWFGKDKPSVLQTLETGITPDGNQLSVPPVQGGRSGSLGYKLHNGIMPLDGTPWDDLQLAILDRWLITYE